MPTMSTPTRSFIRHYIEMLIAMVAGMVALGGLGAAALPLIDTTADQIQADAPAFVLLWMATTMTVPMVAWMRFRGHGWPASVDMALSMFIPTFAAVALLATGAMTDLGALLSIQHVAMLPSMLIAMLLRRDEYTHSHAEAHA